MIKKMEKEEFNKIWRILQRKRKQIFEEWKDKEELLNIWFNEQVKVNKLKKHKARRL